jgi:hypothetical protein
LMEIKDRIFVTMKRSSDCRGNKLQLCKFYRLPAQLNSYEERLKSNYTLRRLGISTAKPTHINFA